MHRSRPISMGAVVLPSMLESNHSSPNRRSDDGYEMESGSGKHRRSRSHPEQLPVPSAVTARHDEDDTVAMSELTLDSNLQQKGKRKESTFKKAMHFVSPAHKSTKPKNPHEKSRFFNKFGAAPASPISSPHDKGLIVDDSSGGHTEETHTPKSGKQRNMLRRAFGGKSESGEKERTHSPATEKTDSRRKEQKRRKDKSHTDSDDEESAAQSMCIRIQVIAKSKYKLCNLDPQNEHDDNWAVVTGNFHQVFFLKSNSNGRPSMSDRLITIKIEK
jgi:hypothetical protein